MRDHRVGLRERERLLIDGVLVAGAFERADAQQEREGSDAEGVREGDRVGVTPAPGARVGAEAPAELGHGIAERERRQRVTPAYAAVAQRDEPGIVGPLHQLIEREGRAPVVEPGRVERVAELVAERSVEHVDEP